MNRQPYGRPSRRWDAKMTPRYVRWSRRYRWRKLHEGQHIASLETIGGEHLQSAIAANKGLLITPNHSAHYDSAALYIAADRVDTPLYFMTAWQVFHMSSRFDCWLMQRMGCFSIDREGNDRQAFKHSVKILQSEKPPLVIFPEGDIYHTTDHVTPFREGAAAIALSAAKKAERPICILPCGIKFWYVDDPREKLLQVTDELEERLYLRRGTGQPLVDRIHRLAEAALALKELDYLGHTCQGRVRVRIRALSEVILGRLETRFDLPSEGTDPERVKVLRQKLIERLERPDEFIESNGRSQEEYIRQWQQDMEDLFFVMQLFSYRGDYLVDNPSIERIAETLDKLEEDILGRELPTIRGRRHVAIQFGEPIEVPPGRQARGKIIELTKQAEQSVQDLIDSLNRHHKPQLDLAID